MPEPEPLPEEPEIEVCECQDCCERRDDCLKWTSAADPEAPQELEWRLEYEKDFPTGAHRIPTSGNGLLCAWYALQNSIRAQFPQVPAPDVDDLGDIYKELARREGEDFWGNVNNFHGDQATMVGQMWMQRHGMPIRVGVTWPRAGRPPHAMVFSHADEFVGKPVLWIHNTAPDGSDAQMAHYEGLRKKDRREMEETPKRNLGCFQDLAKQALRELVADLLDQESPVPQEGLDDPTEMAIEVLKRRAMQSETYERYMEHTVDEVDARSKRMHGIDLYDQNVRKRLREILQQRKKELANKIKDKSWIDVQANVMDPVMDREIVVSDLRWLENVEAGQDVEMGDGETSDEETSDEEIGDEQGGPAGGARLLSLQFQVVPGVSTALAEWEAMLEEEWDEVPRNSSSGPLVLVFPQDIIEARRGVEVF